LLLQAHRRSWNKGVVCLFRPRFRRTAIIFSLVTLTVKQLSTAKASHPSLF
jgi:hypothetical protein